MRQVHSSTVHVLSNEDIKEFIEKEGDAIITSKTNTAIGVFTADCVPVIVVDDIKGVVAVVHSGWRGTISSITKKTIETMNRKFNTDYRDVKVYVGPHIRKCCYEVSQELKETFLEETGIPEDVLFDGRRLSLEECILKDIREIGVLEENIYTLNLCTYCNEDIRLHSYRKSNGGYKVITANNGLDALKKVKENKPDLLLLDLMLPGMDGLDVCKEIKRDKETSKTSIIMLTAKSEELDKILGLELGADDYITKPFSIRELLARVKAVLRRSSSDEISEEIYEIGRLKVDFERHEVLINNEKVELTLKEFELLEILIKNKGKILRRETLLDKVWGYEYIGETRTVDVHIRYLRKKVEDDDKNPKFIETIRGVGYRFNPVE